MAPDSQLLTPCYRYQATLQRVIDGDTYVLVIDLGFYVAIAVHVRLHAVDAPERDTQAGRVATDFVRGVFAAAREVIVESYKDERSFERWVCDVYLDGESLADILVAGGYARAD